LVGNIYLSSNFVGSVRSHQESGRHGWRLLPHSHRASTCASAASAWGSQKVISMARYSSMAVDSSTRAYSTRPTWPYSVPRPKHLCDTFKISYTWEGIEQPHDAKIAGTIWF